MTDVVDLIKLQHRQIDDLLEQTQKAEPDQIATLLQQVAELLVPHSKAEEAFVYPAIQEYDRQEADEAHDAVAEHHHVEELMEQLLADDPSAPGFDGKLAALIGELRHHVEEEESELLPVLSERASDEERAELGTRFAEETGQELEDVEGASVEKPAGKSAGKSTSKSSGRSTSKSSGKSSGAGEGATREELYQRAKEQDLPGRSSMSKDELAKALDEQA